MLIKKLLKFISPGVYPLSIAFFLIIFLFFYKLFNLPSPKELITLIVQWFNQYGLLLLFIAAFLEGVFIIGMYFPGSLAVALAVYSLGKTPLDLIYIGGISFLSFLIANTLNYYLGKFGYYKILLLLGQKKEVDKLKSSITKNAFKIFFLTGFFPNFIAITSVSAGISNLKFPKAISCMIASLMFWVSIWTIVGSLIVKKIDLQDKNQSVYVLGILFLWAGFLIVKENYFSNRRNKSPK